MSHPPSEGEPASEPLPPDLLDTIPELLPSVERILTQESVDDLKGILEKECHVTLSNEQAWESARNLLRFGAMLFDFAIEDERKKAGLPTRPSPFPRLEPALPAPPPVPRAFPIPLDADHDYEIRSNLSLLRDELARAKTYPSSWRWAVVAMYNVLGHALLERFPSAPKDRLHHLLELFDTAAMEVLSVRPERDAVIQLELLRTTWQQRAVREWPISRKELPTLLRRCSEVVRALKSATTLEKKPQKLYT